MSERILVLNVSGIGDFVESTPALRHIRRIYPVADITLAVAEKVQALAQRCPYVNHVVALPTSPGRSVPLIEDLPRWFGAIRPLRDQFDTAINLYGIASRRGAFGMRFLLAWSGARNVVASEGASHVDPPVPAAELCRPELWLSADTINAAEAWIRTLPETPIAVFLGGERRTRHEFPERAVIWLKAIQERWHVHPIVIGSASDPGLPQDCGISHSDVRGRDLEESVAIVACSRALITTHSAPQHFAGVWNIPTVVLVGPGDADRYHPQLSPPLLRMLRTEVACAPCYHMDCPLPIEQKMHCMKGITPEAVAQAFGEVFLSTATR